MRKLLLLASLAVAALAYPPSLRHVEPATQEADESVKSCTNHGKNSTKENPTTCKCEMPCDPTNPHGYSDLAKLKCKTYCRQDACSCKPPCD
jgi:hypothetical protein